jgi:tetratricopeptide (TPR) repeat protein
MRRWSLGLALLLGLPSLAVVQVVSAADSSAVKHDPDNVRAISQYVELLVQANRKLVANDAAGAMEIYKQAIPLAPRNPLGHFYQGAAHIALGDLASAEASYREAESLSDDRNSNLRGKILFALADIKERQGKWEEARAAWQAYTDFAQKHADAGVHPQTGASRLQSLDDVLKLQKQYVAVRERIAAERDGGAAPPDAGKK